MVIQKLCQIRDIYRAISEFETQFEARYSLCFNEAMMLCSLTEGPLTSGEIAERLGLSNSNTSKVIKQVENKQLVERILGKTDKRQMYFSLTPAGKEIIGQISHSEINIPAPLQSLVQTQ